jgi:hypothetical protein
MATKYKFLNPQLEDMLQFDMNIFECSPAYLIFWDGWVHMIEV